MPNEPKSQPPQRAAAEIVTKERIAVVAVDHTQIRIRLVSSETADRIWRALPLHSTAETWGASVHFEIPVKSGRDRTARLNGTAGEIYFWIDEHRILIPFGRTPISKPSECRLPRPCNVWAIALDDVATLAGVEPGSKITLARLTAE